MMRSVLLLIVAASVGAFQSPAFIPQKQAASSSTQLASLNFMNEIKGDFSGPNMIVGHPDDRPTMYPSKAGSLAVMESALPDEYQLAATGTSPVLATRNKKLGKRKSQWITAVFWHEINLYGHTLASKAQQ